jgi:CBS domain-containing protein
VAVRQIMTAGPVTVPASATVERFLHELLPWLRHSAFPVVDDDGQTVGLVTVRRVNAVPADDRAKMTLREVACPLAEVARATPDEPVADLLPRLNACSDGRALVFDGGKLPRDRGSGRHQPRAGTDQQQPRGGRISQALMQKGGGYGLLSTRLHPMTHPTAGLRGGVRLGADRILIFGDTNHRRSAKSMIPNGPWFYGLSLTRVRLRCEPEAQGFRPMPQ